jgi:hypothetical protein
MIYKASDLMAGASKLQKTAMVCFLLGKLMMPTTVFARFVYGPQVGYICLGIYTSLIVACIVICMYDRYYYVPYVEENQIEILEKRLAKLRSLNV